MAGFVLSIPALPQRVPLANSILADDMLCTVVALGVFCSCVVFVLCCVVLCSLSFVFVCEGRLSILDGIF